jgi:hypothetical protein
VLTVAELAGVMGGKRTSDLIPLCHPIALTDLVVAITPDRAAGVLRIRAEAATTGPTGVEMEALTAASVAALTVYDMVKGVERGVEIRGVRLVFTKDALSIICTNNEQEEAEEGLAVDYDGDPLDIGFNISYLLDVLNHVDSPTVTVDMGDSNSSALVQIPGRDDFKYVVMPMRI